MDRQRLEELLRSVRDGDVSVEDGVDSLSHLPVHDLGHTRLDTHRELRCGHAEIVYGAGKTAEQVAEIARTVLEHHDRLLVTRLDPQAGEALAAELPNARFHALSRALCVEPPEPPPAVGRVVVASAGTSDGPVAEEAALTARMLGAAVEELRDVGVAGLHRLLYETEALRSARVLVVVAGMEGALPSVVGGLVQRPVIAVPTSVGYGASFGGLAALLAMLNSCASGITVVNIDNGFGAGFAAAQINRLGDTPE